MNSDYDYPDERGVLAQVVVTLDMLIRLLSKVVLDAGYQHVAAPNDRTDGCRYVNFDGGRLVSVCIIGRLFDYLGILRATVRPGTDVFATNQHGAQYGACEIGKGLWLRAEAMGVRFDEDAQALALRVQEKQDSGKAWGDALRDAVSEWHQAIIDRAKDDQDRALRCLPKAPTTAPWETGLHDDSPF